MALILQTTREGRIFPQFVQVQHHLELADDEDEDMSLLELLMWEEEEDAVATEKPTRRARTVPGDAHP